MKATLLFLSLLLIYLPLNSQSISSEAISSLGGEYQSESSKLSFTVGESAINYWNQGDTKLSEGFHQSYLDVISSIEELEGVTSFKFYPNPTNDFLIMELEGQTDQITGTLYDTQGRLLRDLDIESRTRVDMRPIPPGTYFITLRDRTRRSESITIIKQ